VRVAVLGSGGVAGRHLGVLAQIDGVEVVGHLSTAPARASAQAARWGGRAYSDLLELLDRERPEAAWVCVTPDRHGQVEEALVERQVPFFVEKPLSVDLATAERIAGRLAERPLVTAVGYKFRALDTLPRLRELLAERPARLLLASWHDATPSPTWWRDPARSGGQVIEQATHLVDLARVLVGEGEVLSSALAARRADTGLAQVSAALLRFGDAPAVLTAACLLEGKQSAQLQLVCEGRVLTQHEHGLLVEAGRARDDVRVFADPFRVEDQAFVRAVTDADPQQVLCDYADALRTHRLCAQIGS
jgi:myo-inositol 2-dehydrogenase / D-chiro-inositol 1-dehydrogenase